MQRRRGRGGGGAVAIGIIVVLAVVIIFRSGPRSKELRATAEPAIQAIDQYVQQHGRYPATLAATGETAPLTAYGRYRYQVMPDGAGCSLSVGSDARDGFVLTWDCATRLWTVNSRAHVDPIAAQPAVLSQPEPAASQQHDTTPLV